MTTVIPSTIPYEFAARGMLFNRNEIASELECFGMFDLLNSVLVAVLDESRRLVPALCRLGFKKYQAELINELGETLYDITKTDTFYSIPGIDTNTIARVRISNVTGLGTADIREVTYSYDYDIDQEVYDCDDRECVRTVVTDTHETRHVQEYEINIRLVS